MTKKQENRGGKRAGAGRKKTVRNHSEKTIARYEKAARKLAKEYGMPIEEALLRMIYDPETQDTVKASIMKQYNEALIVKKSESSSESHNYNHQGPGIYLPEANSDPALAVVKGGKK